MLIAVLMCGHRIHDDEVSSSLGLFVVDTVLVGRGLSDLGRPLILRLETIENRARTGLISVLRKTDLGFGGFSFSPELE